MNGGRGALGWAMDSMSIFLVFFAGGVFFAFVLPAGKFAVAALAICVLCAKAGVAQTAAAIAT